MQPSNRNCYIDHTVLVLHTCDTGFAHLCKPVQDGEQLSQAIHSRVRICEKKPIEASFCEVAIAKSQFQ